MIKFGMVLLFSSLIGAVLSSQAVTSQEHRLIRGDMAPGMIAFRRLISDPTLRGYVQPLRLIAPDDSSIQIWNQGGFGQVGSEELLVGLEIGPVYRLKVTSNVRGLKKELYPSIELVDRLHPPEGLQLKHPIKIVIGQSDIEKALQGKLVTKLIYLEDPDSALPFRKASDDQSYFDIALGEDVYAVADRLGRPMAILRMGSRIPSISENAGGFELNGGSVQFYDPQTIEEELNKNNENPKFFRQEFPIPAHQPSTRVRPLENGTIRHANHANGNQRPQSMSGSFRDGSLRPEIFQSDCTDMPDPIVCPPILLACPPERVALSRTAKRDEYVCDGDDRNGKVIVDQSNNLNGLDIEDTIGHFTTDDGHTIVAPSNRVCIYAPGFAAVRKVTETGRSEYTQSLKTVNRRTPLALTQGKDISTVTKQNLQLRSNKGSERASGFRDLTRGVSADNTVQLSGTRSRFKAFEDLQFVRFGKFSSSETARLGLAIQSAVAWDDNVSAQVTVKGAQPVIVNDVYKLQEIVGIKADGSHPTLRLCKLASRISANPGDIVDFTIRFDNLGRSRISDVTILDNLSPRLGYVDGSAQCSADARFKTEPNDAGSLTLRWTLAEPLEVGKGGLIRFQCRVR